MKKPSYIGIDIGTSSMKAILLNDESEVLSECSVKYQNNTPHEDWLEIDPLIWYKSAIGLIQKLLKDEPQYYLKCLGITGQMHTTVFLDEYGNSVRPAILWNDRRTNSEVDEIKEIIKSRKPGHKSLQIISTGSPAANILWLKNHERENYDKTKYIMIGKDYLVFKLSGAYSSDYCDVSASSLFDFENYSWDYELLDWLDIKKELPAINSSSTIVGKVKDEISLELGLEEEVDVVAGTGDNAATYYPTYKLFGSIPIISLGTSGVLLTPTDGFIDEGYCKNLIFSDKENNLLTLVQGTVQSTGSANDWFNNRIIKDESYPQSLEKIDSDLLGNNSVLFVPYLTGDKTVYGNTSIRGAFFGLGINTNIESMKLAVLEGIAYGFRSIKEIYALAGNEIDYAQVVGGGAKSDLWCRVLANILRIKIINVPIKTGAAYGAALLALNSEVVENSQAMICDFRENIQFSYKKDISEKYDKKYKEFLKVTEFIVDQKSSK